jgi:hypothetical protein
MQAADKIKRTLKGTTAEKAGDKLASLTSKLSMAANISSAIILQVGAVTSAILRQDILGATDLVLQFVQQNAVAMREVGLLRGTVLSISMYTRESE